ncbi:hypothetical protein EYF80_061739 [Liparis tanakae]|uniref:Secreted protein n=1 Tax=Liparis tanakae TaxID=230148 RepID=A0A4Z2EI15_9TELE|nr:hypothetical protein EYF80_061739 [Liparis tanakae]
MKMMKMRSGGSDRGATSCPRRPLPAQLFLLVLVLLPPGGARCSSPVSRALISEGIFPWSMAQHHCFSSPSGRVLTISSSSLRAQMALSLLLTSSSRYWYRSFLRARHSLALCRLRSSFAFRSIFAGLRPRFPGFFTLPAAIW